MARVLFSLLDRLPYRLRIPAVRAVVGVLLTLCARITVTGREHIPEGPALFVCNHLSNADGLVLDRVLRQNRPVFVAGVKLQGTPSTRLVSELLQTIVVRPNSPDLDAIRKTVDILRTGQSVLIFPEGGRSRTGALVRGKAGAVVMARRADVPIVPVALMGTERLLPIRDDNMGAEFFRPARVRVCIGEPFTLAELQVSGDEADERQALIDALMRRIARLLDPAYQGVYTLDAWEQKVG